MNTPSSAPRGILAAAILAAAAGCQQIDLDDTGDNGAVCTDTLNGKELANKACFLLDATGYPIPYTPADLIPIPFQNKFFNALRIQGKPVID